MAFFVFTVHTHCRLEAGNLAESMQ